MPVPHQTTYLFASNEPGLLEAVEPALLASGAHVEIVLSAEAALAGITASPAPSLVLLDVRLPGMEIGRLLAAVRAKAGADASRLCSSPTASPRSGWIGSMRA